MKQILLSHRSFIVSFVFVLTLIGCAKQGASAERKQNSYAELVYLLGVDISTTDNNGMTVVEYCPDNTCESFSMSSAKPIEKLNDFVYLYLYYVSDYYFLGDFRKKVAQEQVTILILRNEMEVKQREQLLTVKAVIEALAENYSIKAKFVRYDESKRNVVPIDIKSRLKRILGTP